MGQPLRRWLLDLLFRRPLRRHGRGRGPRVDHRRRVRLSGAALLHMRQGRGCRGSVLPRHARLAQPVRQGLRVLPRRGQMRRQGLPAARGVVGWRGVSLPGEPLLRVRQADRSPATAACAAQAAALLRRAARLGQPVRHDVRHVLVRRSLHGHWHHAWARVDGQRRLWQPAAPLLRMRQAGGFAATVAAAAAASASASAAVAAAVAVTDIAEASAAAARATAASTRLQGRMPVPAQWHLPGRRSQCTRCLVQIRHRLRRLRSAFDKTPAAAETAALAVAAAAAAPRAPQPAAPVAAAPTGAALAAAAAAAAAARGRSRGLDAVGDAALRAPPYAADAADARCSGGGREARQAARRRGGSGRSSAGRRRTRAPTYCRRAAAPTAAGTPTLSPG